MKVYVARHGQTQWNVENKVCGRTDLPMTEYGQEQAEQLAKITKDLPIDRIISSTMIRGLIQAGREWSQFVPPATYRFIREQNIDERIVNM